MSYAEDEGFDGWGVGDIPNSVEQNWADGYHVDKDGNELLLSEMTVSHLENVIKFFPSLDTTPLQEELRKRNNMPIQISEDKEWQGSVEIEIRKQCEGAGCTEYFNVEWPGQRRCPRCRKENRSYHKEDEPF